MPTPTIVVARRPRRSRKPLAPKPEPACGPVVRHVRGKRVRPEAPGDPEAEALAREGFERLMADPRQATLGDRS